MIKEDYVSVEVAQLLKEKGFLKEEDLRITQNLSFYDNIGLHHNLNKYYNSLILDKIDFVVAPTHQMAMKWLREVYGLIISIEYQIICPTWKWRIYIKSSDDKHTNFQHYNKYEEAVEAALKYCLENLI